MRQGRINKRWDPGFKGMMSLGPLERTVSGARKGLECPPAQPSPCWEPPGTQPVGMCPVSEARSQGSMDRSQLCLRPQLTPWPLPPQLSLPVSRGEQTQEGGGGGTRGKEPVHSDPGTRGIRVAVRVSPSCQHGLSLFLPGLLTQALPS